MKLGSKFTSYAARNPPAMSAPVRYQLSGKLGPSLYVLPLMAVLVGTLGGMLYGYLVVLLVHWSLLSALAQIVLVVGVAIAVGVTGNMSKCRSSLFMAAMTLLGALSMLYAIWATFAYMVPFAGKPTTMLTLVDWFNSPGTLWNFLSDVSAKGWYTTRARYSSRLVTHKGVELLIGWTLEAVAILSAFVAIAYGSWSGNAFCESCDDWCDETKNAAARDVSDLLEKGGSLESKLKSGLLAELVALPPVGSPGDGKTHVVVDQQLCKKCGNMGTFRLRKLEYKRDKKGKLDESDSNLTPLFVLDVESIVALGKLTASVPETAPDPEQENPV